MSDATLLGKGQCKRTDDEDQHTCLSCRALLTAALLIFSRAGRTMRIKAVPTACTATRLSTCRVGPAVEEEAGRETNGGTQPFVSPAGGPLLRHDQLLDRRSLASWI